MRGPVPVKLLSLISWLFRPVGGNLRPVKLLVLLLLNLSDGERHLPQLNVLSAHILNLELTDVCTAVRSAVRSAVK